MYLYVYGGNVFLQYIFAGAYTITMDVIFVYTWTKISS